MNLNNRNKEMRDFFNRKIDEYDSVHLKMMDNKVSLVECLPDDTKKVLDLGAGTGLELVPLFERFPDAIVTAIDITENMLKELEKRDFSKKVKCICGDFFEVVFDNGYDAVISSASLHHFTEEDKDLLYKKIYDCLTENGQFINSDRFVETQEEQDKMMREYEKDSNLHPHMDTPLTLENEKKLLNKVGFKSIKSLELNDERYKILIAKKNNKIE